MNRKEFLSMLGVGAAVATCTACFGGCKKEDSVAAPPTNVDFTLDVTDPLNSSINGTGLVKNGLIIVKTTGSTYVALSAACTHQGTTVQYDRSHGYFYCSSHGSEFSTGGSVLQGPAGTPLTKYNTSLSGNMLRVYS